MGTRSTDALPDVRRALRVIAFVALVLVTLSALAIGWARWDDRLLDRSQTATVCTVAEQRVQDDRSEQALVLFGRAGIDESTLDQVDGSCRRTWTDAQRTVAGIRIDRLPAACGDATQWIEEGRLVRAEAALHRAGVNTGNAQWLSDDCALAWALIATEPTPTPSPSAATQPSPSASATGTAVTAAGEQIGHACRLASRQLDRGDAAAAVATLKASGAAAEDLPPSCQAVSKLALALVPAPAASDPDTGPERAGGWWDDFVERYIAPLASVGAFFLGAVLALTVAARLLVELPALRHLDSDRRSRRRAALLGWAIVFSSSFAAAALGVGVAAGSLGGWSVVVAFAGLLALGLVGALAIACALATMLRVTISVEPEDSAVTQAAVLAQLRALASASEYGMELRSPATIEDASTALSALSKTAWIAAAQRIVLFLVGVKPWTASIAVDGTRAATVVLTRNGRIVAATRVALDSRGCEELKAPYPPGVGDAQVLAAFIAAEILLGMRPAYPDDFRAGLSGATVSKSVALQHVAQTWYFAELTGQAERLLTAAVAADPENRLAVVSLQHARFRTSDVPADLIEYGLWIDQTLAAYEESPE